jgi:3-oxoacyl-[acyl-carrier-protein] synthase III
LKFNSQIESIGIKLPEKSLKTSDLFKESKISSELKLELLTGISSRYICSDGEDSLTLAVDAANDCLKYSCFPATEIEMLICCSITRYVNGLTHCFEPALSLLIKEKIGARQALSFDISNACAGMLTGIQIANDFIERGMVKNCMVVSGEYITSLSRNALRHVFSRNNSELASLTLGDAGAAVILTKKNVPEEGPSVSFFTTLGQHSDLCMGFQSNKYPGGFMKTKMKKIHEVSILNAPPIIEQALREVDLTIDQINFLIPHQTSKYSILAGGRYFSKYFGARPGEFVVNLENCGNTASTAHFLALYRYLKENRIRKGDRIMLLGFASGLVIGLIILTVDNLIDRYGNNH